MPVGLHRLTTSPRTCPPAQTALQQRNVTATAVALLSTSLGPPVDAANAPSDAFPSAVASASSAGVNYPQRLPVAAIAGVAAGAAALFLAVRRKTSFIKATLAEESV